jgi:hypothetical protein
VLLNRLRRLRINAEHFAAVRATTPADRRFACRLADGLDDLLARLDGLDREVQP